MGVWALFVQFTGDGARFLPDGWIFQGIYTDPGTLNRATLAVEAAIERTRGQVARTVTYKVVELS